MKKTKCQPNIYQKYVLNAFSLLQLSTWEQRPTITNLKKYSVLNPILFKIKYRGLKTKTVLLLLQTKLNKCPYINTAFDCNVDEYI